MQTRACLARAERMKVSRENPPFYDKTLVNAKRLLADSKLLVERGRAHSAIILGVFAIEELGKALITRWSVRNRASKREFPTHVEKQAATFALMSAAEHLSDLPRARKYMARGTLNFLKFGPHSHQFAWARAGFYDDLRMAVTYADAEPKIPDEIREQIGVELAGEINGFFETALACVDNNGAMDLAAAIYENGLGRL